MLSKTRVQRKKLSKEDEASMDVEVNLLQQRFNKIELEKLIKKSFTLRNRKKGKNIKRINVTNAIKLIKKFKAHLIRKSVLIKHLRNPIQDYLICVFQEKENI